MSEEQQNIALESDDEDDNDSNSPIMSFQDDRQFQAFLAANPEVNKKYQANQK